MAIITRDFYSRPALAVARDLLGCHLVRDQNGVRLAGLILETEAYQGEDDLGCHASVGMTPRTAVMYGPPGHAYVYFTYGMHWLLNAVCDHEAIPAAVLIRSIQPVEGQQQMAKNRPFNALQSGWTDGPAKLTQALAVTDAFNRTDLSDRSGGLWIEQGEAVPDAIVEQTSRVGLNSVPELWRSVPWRFVVKGEVQRGS